MTAKYWRSLSEYNNEESFEIKKQDEFLEGVTEEFNTEEMESISRRKFLAVLAASTAFVAVSCTDYQDKGEIIPYNKRPKETLPGEANYYASTCSACANNCGILIKTREGRPVKVDGNPEHPINKGKICAIGQAAILNLYDPDRLKEPTYKTKETDWLTINKNIIKFFDEAKNNNKEIALMTNAVTSYSFKKLLNTFVATYPNSKVYSYDIKNNKNKSKAWFNLYNQTNLPKLMINKAEVILSIDSDFIAKDGNFVENAVLLSEKKNIANDILPVRLYSVESEFSLAGMNADYRFRLDSSKTSKFIYHLYNYFVNNTDVSEIYNLFKSNGIKEKQIDLLLNDIKSNFGKTLIIGGDNLSVEDNQMLFAINEKIGAENLYDFSLAFNQIDYSEIDELKRLTNKMEKGEVEVIINFDTNPVFNLKGLNFEKAFKKVKTKISLVETNNETSNISDYILPINHNYESWGDFYARKGFVSLSQPVIAPIFNTRQKESILLSWLNNGEFSQDNIRKYIKENINNELSVSNSLSLSFDNLWIKSLQDGFINLNENSIAKNNISNFIISKPKESDNLELLIKSSYFIGDGKYANNGWLQEIPHPASKVTWDNYAAISPNLAKNYKLKNGDMINISTDNGNIKLPIMIQPGMPDKTVVVEYGYGREVIGEVGRNVGFDVYSLVKDVYNTKVAIKNISVVGENYKIVTSQEHHAVDDSKVADLHKKRSIIQEGTLDEYLKNKNFLHEKHHHKIFSITKDHEYNENKWVMSIDLNKCIGCSVCVASCNVENNIPVVGKDQISRGRSMHWMRIDRYYSGTPDNPEVSFQPMLCQHCDNAPCENVCPVNATNHSPDGLNQMVYNRCVGTRYCANNCPYKVRRFNYYNFRDHFAKGYYENDLTHLINNPEVTVRSRGVMEKCTFCVQKIMEARAVAIRENREIVDADIKTACQQACPTNAIVFGNINNEKSEIVKYRNHKLSYHILEVLNIKPNVTYIAKLRNTNEEKS